jgi:hypothetical protein
MWSSTACPISCISSFYPRAGRCIPIFYYVGVLSCITLLHLPLLSYLPYFLLLASIPLAETCTVNERREKGGRLRVHSETSGRWSQNVTKLSSNHQLLRRRRVDLPSSSKTSLLSL